MKRQVCWITDALSYINKGRSCCHWNTTNKCRYPTGSMRSFSHTCIHPHKRMQMLLEADPHPNAADRVFFVASLSACVGMLHHISGDGGGEGAESLCLMLGYMVAHRQAGRRGHVGHNGRLCASSSCYHIICRVKRGCRSRRMNH